MLQDRYITQILISVEDTIFQQYQRFFSDINDSKSDDLFVHLYSYELNLKLIHEEKGQLIYYTHCYIKNVIRYISMYCKGENIYLNDNDIGYNYINDNIPIFFPFDFENTYSITYSSQLFGKFACTVFVEKPYYKYWLIKSLSVDIDVMNIIQHLMKDVEDLDYIGLRGPSGIRGPSGLI